MKKYIRTTKNELLKFDEIIRTYTNAHTKEIYHGSILVDKEGDYLQQVVGISDLVKFKNKIIQASEISKYEIENYATEIYFKVLSGFSLVAIRNKKGEWETI